MKPASWSRSEGDEPHPATRTDLDRVLRDAFSLFKELALKVQSFGRSGDAGLDGMLIARWGGRSQRYAFECKNVGTPKVVQAAALQVKHLIHRYRGARPLVVAPYLSEERMAALTALEVSGLDFCGNCMLRADDFMVWRSGRPNRFPLSQPIKNVFRGRSSMLTRCFLIQPHFRSLTALRDFSAGRLLSDDGKPITLGTASKVVGVLEQQLKVAKDESGLRLIDAQRLMGALRNNYRPAAGGRVIGKIGMAVAGAQERLQREHIRSVVTGLGSASRYGVLSSSGRLYLYVSDLAKAAEMLGVEETRVFPDLELIEEKSDVVYFDARPADGRRWASPVQTWLELASAGPRERQAARTLEADLRDGKGV